MLIAFDYNTTINILVVIFLLYVNKYIKSG